jgi:hypothetical protein
MVKRKRQVLGDSWFFFAGTMGQHGSTAAPRQLSAMLTF